ncbi:hypothetical protein [Streptomyces neyagawaensis]|uniref:hypothetical protein n=1 Tax=Streptomyces neyagawaensis TaxID=42238 RepID=UPI0006E411CB|nr:hypothetical protein [Streptomyces neyagawaensis]MCL6738595.1 hypothetical protein [Streptomyces neyagawaensis]MDE1681856.1 hypothetical protein [Streptomyces neyagawaensis]
MSETLTLDDLAAALRVLRVLAVDFGHLPAPDVQVSPIYPDRLELRFHRDLPDFEAWREALGIAPDAVVYREQNAGRTRVLKASADYAGATLELTGYGDVRAPELVGGAA